MDESDLRDLLSPDDRIAVEEMAASLTRGRIDELLQWLARREISLLARREIAGDPAMRNHTILNIATYVAAATALGKDEAPEDEIRPE